MIDWWGLFTASLWILGLSVLLATFSLRGYRRSLLKAAGAPLDLGRSRGYPLGLLLLSLGLGAGSDWWLEQLLWGVLALLTVAELVVSLRKDAHRPDVVGPSPAQPPDH
jgi:hypothetical protein